MIVQRSDPAELSAGKGSCLPDDDQPSPASAGGRLAHLRGTLARMEAGFNGASPDVGQRHFQLGDDVACPALRLAALHEVTAREAGDGAAALAFALALTLRATSTKSGKAGGVIQARAPSHGRILLVLEGLCAEETGWPYAHGLAGFGLDPGQCLLLSPRRAITALWAIEEGLRCGALAGVIGVFARLPRAYDLTASRRLVLAARRSGLPAILAVIGEGGVAPRIGSAAETRWQIAARPSTRGIAGEPTAPAFLAELLRRRGGEPMTFDLDWNHDTRSFTHSSARSATYGLADAPLSGALVAPFANRPGEAARAG